MNEEGVRTLATVYDAFTPSVIVDGHVYRDSATGNLMLKENSNNVRVRDAALIRSRSAEQMTAKGDIYAYDGAGNIVVVPVGSTGQQLTVDPTTESGLAYKEPMGMDLKGGTITAASFEGTSVKTCVVTFAEAFDDTDYSITLGVGSTDGMAQFPVTWYSKTAAGFTVSLGTANKNNLVAVDWHAQENGEF